MEHLDALPDGETGRLLFQVDGKDAGEPIASEVSKVLRGKMVLGLLARCRRDAGTTRRAGGCLPGSSER